MTAFDPAVSKEHPGRGGGRRAFLMEIDPLYCDVIVRRWEEFTGKKAGRVATASESKENNQ